MRGDLSWAGAGRGDRRVRCGPGVHAKAALAVCARYLPVARAARLVAALTGVNVWAGYVASIRGRPPGCWRRS